MSNYGSDFGGGGYESGQNSQVQGGDTEGYESAAEADGDEVDGHMQNEMEDEDTYGYSAEGDDSDESDGEENAEEVPNPAACNQDHSSAMTVNDGHDSAWQYHENNIAKGAMYTEKQALRDACIKWALSTHGVMRTVASSQKYLTMECEDINCPGRVHGHLPKNGYCWRISDFIPHSCVIDNVSAEQIGRASCRERVLRLV